MNVVSYRDFEEVPDIFWQEFEEDYINENTVVLTYETDFPERKIAELRELEEVPEDITDEMVEEERDNLTRLYNIKAIAGWHRENLTAEGWETLDTDRNLEDNLSYQHNREGYFIIAPPENLIYTPQN